jgi:thiamine pyrophosphokinase
MAEKVLGVLAGGDLPDVSLGAWAASADLVFAADGGVNRLAGLGIRPDLLIGDFDSVNPHLRDFAKEVVPRPGQDESDCDKLLAEAARRGHADIVLVGIEGDRLDHTLAVLAGGLRTSLRVATGLRTGMGYLLKPGRHSIKSVPGATVSVLPLLPTYGVRLEGVRWPLVDAELRMDGLISLSNQATEDSVRLEASSGAVWVVISSGAPPEPSWSFWSTEADGYTTAT